MRPRHCSARPLIAASLLFAAGCGAPDPEGSAPVESRSFALTSADPGPRRLSANPNLPPPLAGLSPSDQALFTAATAQFNTAFSVSGTFTTNVNNNPKTFPGSGLGPRWNSFSCRECHGTPFIGGSSFATSGQSGLATGIGTDYGILAPGQTNPPFLTSPGPSLAARLKYNPDNSRDGEVHPLFTISGRPDAPGCNIPQVDWAAQVAANNVSVRITTPTFGAGLLEAIADTTIIAGKTRADTAAARAALGISGHENVVAQNAVGRFGWKAQIRTLPDFVADAFIHEMGVTTAKFPAPNDSTVACNFKSGIDDVSVQTPSGPMLISDVNAAFMRLSAPRPPIAFTASALNGQSLFSSTGCVLCHTASMTTAANANAALSLKSVPLYSDLLVHHMGPALADDIIQGTAGPDEFRTAPLWGLGQRYYFLHDGRTADLKAAISAHASAANAQFPASEANGVVAKYNALGETQKQDLLNFLRAL